MSYKNAGKKKIITAVAIFIVIAVSVFMSVAPKMNLPFSWDGIFKETGLKEDTTASENPFSVHYIDVGQGDCIFIKSDGESMLIDCGESENAEKVVEYLEKYNVTELKYLIATHPHSDHIGAMPYVIENTKIDNFIMPRLTESNTPTTKIYEKLLTAVGKSGANVIAAVPGNEYLLGNAKITILAPITQTDELNDMSVICKIDYYETSFLFTGDAEKFEEDKVMKNNLDLSADVLKVGHHGSNSSSSMDFLKAVNPRLAIISCGEDNVYNHPGEKAIERLDSMNIEYKRTDLNGTVIIGSDGENIIVTQEKGK